jgi:predicted ATPase/class 3 adenylate cyclase
MPELPAGTVTFLFTDIEGSTRLWEQHPEPMRAALARHDALLTAGIQQHGGQVVKSRGEGDSLFAVFARASDALAAAGALQQALLAEPWPDEAPLRVRVALHTGEASFREGDYYGAAVNRCARLRAAAHGGQVLLSGATEELVRAAVPEGASLRDLGSHRLQDLTHPEHVFQLLHPDLPAEFPPLRSLDALPHNLPRQLTSFIGREQAMARVKELLSRTSLLTLTGSGGCGKTRLALQVAGDLLAEYPAGVWLVELAPLGDPALVPQTVAAALGVREEPGRPLTTTLTDYLRPKQVLLVLDNCEHLLTACAQLADALLRGCPRLRLLASSREALGIGGEQTYRVPSLSVPDARHLPPLERLHEFEAVQLFSDRARLSQASFAVTPANAPAVALVCQRLDGIPLALELAAARVRALPVEQIHTRLDDMFRLLTGGSRTALPRQQTLRALIDWSYDLLSEAERTLLRRLSVFAGGWTLAAAEAVGSDQWTVGSGVKGMDQGGIDSAGLPTAHCLLPTDVLDLLTSLVDKSLVTYDDQGGEGRYRLLETVRQYARDRLLDAGEAGVRSRHLEFFVRLAEQAEPELKGPDQVAWLDRLEREHDNLRAALAWSREAVENGLRLGGALAEFWAVRGYWTEGQEQLAGLLALQGTQARTTARARALHGAGLLAWQQGGLGAARALLEESVAISRELGNPEDIARTLVTLGLAAHFDGDDVAARAQLEESLRIFRELRVKTGIAGALDGLGLVSHNRGEYGAARPLLEECLALSREVGNRQGIAGALGTLGAVARRQEPYEAARALLEESLALFRELGDKFGIILSLLRLGGMAHDQGEYGAARAHFEERLAIARELGNKHGITWALGDLGEAARLQGDDGAAAALYEESLAISQGEGDKGGIVNSLLGLAHVAQAQGNPAKARALLEEARAIDEGTDTCMGQGHLLLEMGDYAAARSRYEEGLALRRERGDNTGLLAWALLEVGHAAWLQGEPAVTQSHALEALALFQERENKAGRLAALESLAVAALAPGSDGDSEERAPGAREREPSRAPGAPSGAPPAQRVLGKAGGERAARLLGAVEAQWEALGLPPPPWWRRPRERLGEAVRAAGLDPEFAAAWAKGRAMALEQACAYALQGEADA